MDDRSWRRHANPWSFYTRFLSYPLLVAAAWSRVWIGGWWWLVLGLVLALIWVNPRLFPPPHTTRRWSSKGVLGERVLTEHPDLPLPGHFRRGGRLLNLASGMGFIAMLVGLWWLHPWLTAFGATVSFMAKLWYVDRMAWLFETVRGELPEVDAWLY